MNKEKSSEKLNEQRYYDRSGGGYQSNSFQENRGKRWTSEEDMYLLQQISFLSQMDIGKHLRRSENAVVSRLKKLAFNMIQNGEDPVVVQNNLKLSKEDIEQINNECFIYPRRSTSKFITTTKKTLKKGYFESQPSQEMQLLLEIRNMMRKILYQTQNFPPVQIYRGPRNEQTQIRISDLNMEELEKHSEEFAKTNEV